ncbi:MAG: PfkB family carbohydrate kinase [Acidobacteria bacterium]|nr:PfkB family carbohydrate kinase [Acidobacteriota bacterium]
MVDVVGVGANSVDRVYRLPAFPSPSGPSSKLRIAQHAVMAGGQTATTLCTCAAMGLTTRYVGASGNDDSGRLIRDELSRRSIDITHAVVRDAANAYAVILIDDTQGERVVLWDRDPRLNLTPGEIDAAAVADARLLHVDDVDVEAALHAASIARKAGVPITSDIETVGNQTDVLVAAVTVPIFAEHVLEPLTGERDIERALRVVRRRHAGMLCVTLGSRGAMLLAGDRLYGEPACPTTVVDTTGAGDVFRGGFITALLRGDAPEDILRFANAAAAISCSRAGAIASVPSLEETASLHHE